MIRYCRDKWGEVDPIQETQNKGQFPSEVARYSIADNQTLREVSREQIGVPKSQLLEHL
jgi:hypothetical protein